MRLAIVTRFPKDPARPHGGVESVSVNLVRALRELNGLEIHVVTMYPGFTDVGQEKWGDVTIHRLPWTGRKILTHVQGAGRRQMHAYLRKLAPDVIHAHDSMYGLTVQGLEIPRVFTVHGFVYADTLLQPRFPRLRSWLWRRAEFSCWADQPHIVSISPYVRERLAGVARGVIHDIDNPISESFFDIQHQETPGRIFSAAGISYRKNTLGLVKAFARLKEMGVQAELRLAGSANSEAYADSIRRFIDEHGLQDRVRILGRLDYIGVMDELRQAAVFALVSLEENSPMAIEEAMAAGIPIATSNRCGMPYMVRDGESGFLVDPTNPDDVALRLKRILEDSSLRTAMGVKSRAIALDRFHPRRIAERTYEVYLQAIQDKGRRGHA